MHLCVMPQGLEMPNALDRVSYRFAVDYAAAGEFCRYAEALADDALNDLELHLAHQAEAYSALFLIPADGELRLFLLKLSEGREGGVRVSALRKLYGVPDHRPQKFFLLPRRYPVSLPREAVFKPGDGDDGSRRGLLHKG